MSRVGDECAKRPMCFENMPSLFERAVCLRRVVEDSAARCAGILCLFRKGIGVCLPWPEHAEVLRLRAQRRPPTLDQIDLPLATLELPAWGYGLRYKFGNLKQYKKSMKQYHP